ncbi:hypothetical protein BKA69DRAFT_349499 [Paraphysoderma sedebokerense]|nr:hypothetical protein BKA69DRAFT_349499 [Paraphysoderma sedebokerense]
MDSLPTELIWEISSHLIPDRHLRPSSLMRDSIHSAFHYHRHTDFLQFSELNHKFRIIVLSAPLHRVKVSLPKDQKFIDILHDTSRKSIRYVELCARNFRVSPNLDPSGESLKLIQKGLQLLPNVRHITVTKEFLNLLSLQIDELKSMDLQKTNESSLAASPSTTMLKAQGDINLKSIQILLPHFPNLSIDHVQILTSFLNALHFSPSLPIDLCNTCQNSYYTPTCIISSCSTPLDACPTCLFQAENNSTCTVLSALTCSNHQKEYTNNNLSENCVSCFLNKGAELCVNSRNHPYMKMRYCIDCAVFELPYVCVDCHGWICFYCVQNETTETTVDSDALVESLKCLNCQHLSWLHDGGVKLINHF